MKKTLTLFIFLLLIPTTLAQITFYEMPSQNPTLLNQSKYKFNSTNPAPSNLFPQYFYLEGVIIENETPINNTLVFAQLLGSSLSIFQLDDNTNRTYYDSVNISNHSISTYTNELGYFYIELEHAGFYNITALNKSIKALSYTYLDKNPTPQTQSSPINSPYEPTLDTDDIKPVFSDTLSKTIITLGTGLLVAIPFLILFLSIGVVKKWKK
jgi:hypothetical protein